MMTALPNRQNSGHCTVTKEDGTQEYLEKEMWRWGSGTAGGRWRQSHKTKMYAVYGP